MSKLSLDALKNRAEAIASEELMSSISGGTENGCHDGTPPPAGGGVHIKDYDQYMRDLIRKILGL
jgi:hypothetical protein